MSYVNKGEVVKVMKLFRCFFSDDDDDVVVDDENNAQSVAAPYESCITNRIEGYGFFDIEEQWVKCECLDIVSDGGIQKLRDRLSSSLKDMTDGLANDENIPEEFKSNIDKLIFDWIHTISYWPENGHERPDCLLMQHQIIALLENPMFLNEVAYVKMLNSLATLVRARIWYVHYVFNNDGLQLLSDGMSISHLPALERIIDQQALWESPDENARRIYIASIAHVVNILTKSSPEKTISVRLKILEYCIENGKNPEILFHVVNTFTSDKDIAMLKDTLKQRPPLSKMAQEINKILSGYYEGMTWSI